MPRPFTELTEAQLAEVETLAAVLSTQQMADYFGIGRTTFYALMDRDPEVAERYKRGRAKAVGAVAQSLIAKARSGNVVAMIFFLKTQGGWRETDRHEVVATSDAAADADAFCDRIERLALQQSLCTESALAVLRQKLDGPQATALDAEVIEE